MIRTYVTSAIVAAAMILLVGGAATSDRGNVSRLRVHGMAVPSAAKCGRGIRLAIRPDPTDIPFPPDTIGPQLVISDLYDEGLVFHEMEHGLRLCGFIYRDVPIAAALGFCLGVPRSSSFFDRDVIEYAITRAASLAERAFMRRREFRSLIIATVDRTISQDDPTHEQYPGSYERGAKIAALLLTYYMGKPDQCFRTVQDLSLGLPARFVLRERLDSLRYNWAGASAFGSGLDFMKASLALAQVATYEDWEDMRTRVNIVAVHDATRASLMREMMTAAAVHRNERCIATQLAQSLNEGTPGILLECEPGIGPRFR